MNRVHRLLRSCASVVVALAAIAAFSDAKSAADEPVAIFHVGNSLTDQAYGMHDIAKAKGHPTKFGRHMIPGAPLNWLWEHRSEGFREPGKGAADEILSGSKWDVLILQPFGSAVDVSVEFGAKYAEAAYKGNPDCQVFVFGNYPAVGKNLDKAGGDWEKLYLSKTENRGQANFEAVTKGIAAKFPNRKPVRLIPVGDVMLKMHQKMKDGKVPGFKAITELYADGTHLNAEGKYLEAVTHYATVFADDPHGAIIAKLRFWKAPYEVNKEYAEIVWDVAWDVVTSNPLTGVKAKKK